MRFVFSVFCFLSCFSAVSLNARDLNQSYYQKLSNQLHELHGRLESLECRVKEFNEPTGLDDETDRLEARAQEIVSEANSRLSQMGEDIRNLTDQRNGLVETYQSLQQQAEDLLAEANEYDDDDQDSRRMPLLTEANRVARYRNQIGAQIKQMDARLDADIRSMKHYKSAADQERNSIENQIQRLEKKAESELRARHEKIIDLAALLVGLYREIGGLYRDAIAAADERHKVEFEKSRNHLENSTRELLSAEECNWDQSAIGKIGNACWQCTIARNCLPESGVYNTELPDIAFGRRTLSLIFGDTVNALAPLAKRIAEEALLEVSISMLFPHLGALKTVTQKAAGVLKLPRAGKELLARTLEKIKYSAGKGEWAKVFSDKIRPSELLKDSSLEKKFRTDKGIPGNWEVKLSKGTKKEPGALYHAPGNTHQNVRVMPGSPNNPNPVSQKPYVVWKKDGKTLDKFGNPSTDPNKTHIPLDEFKFKG